MDFKKIIKYFLPHFASILIIVGAVSFYMAPQLNGKIIAGGDVVSATAWSKQVIDYKAETGIGSKWNPSMFSGMPWGLLSAGSEYNLLRKTDSAFKLGVKPAMGILIKLGLVCYLSLILLGVRSWIALLGAIAFTFSVNNIILLEAGHQSKLNVLANFPLILAGLLLCYREKWKVGVPAIALGTSIAISNNHIQMVYYLLLCFVVFGLVYLIDAYKTKQLKTFFKMSGFALGAALIGALSNFSILTSAKNFSDDTMRGKPILESTASVTSGSSSTTKGLDWEYAMQWSNGIKDLASIIIPRIVGGSSYEEVSYNSATGRLLRSNNAKRGKDNTYQAPMYWGGLPFTSGPYYSSMVLISLFALSFFLIPIRLRWGLGLMALFILIISMGKHVSWLNKPMFDYLPLLNKFRAPNSAVSVLPLILVFGCALGLQSFLLKENRKLLIKPVLYGVGGLLITAFLIALMGSSVLSFEGLGDARYAPEVKNIFKETRMEMFRSDAWRSVGLSLAVMGLLMAYAKNYLKSGSVLSGILCALLFIDLYSVDQRHLDIDNWESRGEYDQNFALRPADEQILQAEPKGRGYYRVFDIPNMTRSVGSYHHNTIGGYHAAKLQRYQDMLDFHINKGERGVLNMLNAKYTITAEQMLQVNRQALGNAWCVQEVRFVDTPNQEIESLTGIDPGVVAIVNSRDFPDVAATIQPSDGSCSIELTEYLPNKLRYSFSSTTNQFVLFSEVWYDQEKGMTARIDGQEVDFVRANYILRGLQVPAGTHTIEFSFIPKAKGAAISVVASLLIIGLIMYNLFFYIKGLSKSLKPVEVKKTTVKKTRRIKKKKNSK